MDNLIEIKRICFFCKYFLLCDIFRGKGFCSLNNRKSVVLNKRSKPEVKEYRNPNTTNSNSKCYAWIESGEWNE